MTSTQIDLRGDDLADEVHAAAWAAFRRGAVAYLCDEHGPVAAVSPAAGPAPADGQMSPRAAWQLVAGAIPEQDRGELLDEALRVLHHLTAAGVPSLPSGRIVCRNTWPSAAPVSPVPAGRTR